MSMKSYVSEKLFHEKMFRENFCPISCRFMIYERKATTKARVEQYIFMMTLIKHDVL